MVILSFGLVSCTKKEPTQIKTNEIFAFQGGYYVYFYSNACMACVETTQKLRQLDQSGKYRIYFFDISKNHIQSPAGDYSNVGVSLVKDIKIRSTPTLLWIEDGVVRQELIGSTQILKIE